MTAYGGSALDRWRELLGRSSGVGGYAGWASGTIGGTNNLGIFNVKDAPFSAKGDGVTDDTAAIQAAIDACPIYGVVFVPQGSYKLTDSLIFTRPLRFCGVGNGSIFNVAASVGDTTDVFVVAPPANGGGVFYGNYWEFVDFSIYTTTARHAIYLDGTNNIIRDALFTGLVLTGVRSVGNAIYATAQNPAVGDGIPHTTTIQRNVLTNGITFLDAGDQVKIRDNHIVGVGGIDVTMQLAAGLLVIENNVITSDEGIHIGYANSPIIRGNQFETLATFTGSNGAFVDIDGDDTTYRVNEAVVSDNDFQIVNAIHTTCIRVNWADRTLIYGNKLYAPYSDSLDLDITTNARDTEVGVNAYVAVTPGYPIRISDLGVNLSGTMLRKPLWINSGASTVETEFFRLGRVSDFARYNSIYSTSNSSGLASIAFKVHDGVTGTSQATVMTLLGSGEVAAIGPLDLEGSVELPAMTAGGTTGVYAGPRSLARIFQPALAAGGQAQGDNFFAGGGNSTMTNGAGASTLASNNTAVGVDSFLANTTGFQNTAVGHEALKANTTGGGSVAVGEGALFSAETCIDNTAVGTSALYTLTSGNFNTAVGFDALRVVATGTGNTALGKRSNWQMTAGNSNTSVGTDSLYSNLTGGSNTAVGLNTLYANTDGASNVAVGASALAANTTGSQNVAIGQAAALNTKADTYNVSIGTSAGRYLADGSTPLTSAATSVFVGGLTKSKQDSQFDETVIGYGATGAGTHTAVVGASTVTDVYCGGAAGAAAIHGTTLDIAGATARFGAAATYDGIIISPAAKGANQFDGTITSADLTAARTWTMPNASGTMLIAQYGGMYQYTGAAATVIATAAEYYALTQMVTGLQQGFTFIAGTGGGPGAAITSVTTLDGGAKITVNATGTWVTGQPVTIHGTTDYDGAFLITTGGTNSFVLSEGYHQDRTGVARGACALKCTAGSAGTYEIGFTSSVSSVGFSKAWHMEANKNTTPLDNVASAAESSANSTARNLSGLGHATVADGDVLWMSIYNDTDASNLTVRMINFAVKRIGS